MKNYLLALALIALSNKMVAQTDTLQTKETTINKILQQKDSRLIKSKDEEVQAKDSVINVVKEYDYKKSKTIEKNIVDTSPKEKSNFWKNVRFGGGIGLGFGNNSTTISISPTAVYDFNDKFSLGLGLGYQYSKRNNIKSNVYSVSALSLYNPFRGLQLSAEFEQLFANQSLQGQTFSREIPALYLGAAYRVSRNIAMGIRYDVLYDENESIYSSAISPIVRIFF